MTGFRTDVKEAVRETAEGIGQMARESKENIERLSRDLEGFWRDQEEVLGRVRPLLGTWGVVKRVLESQSVFNKGGGVRGGGGRELMVPWMWSGFVLLYFVVATVLTLIYGVRTARKSIYISSAAIVFAGTVPKASLTAPLLYLYTPRVIPMVASVAITILCEWWRLPTVSFIHLFMGIVCFRWGLYSIRSWRYYYHSRHQFLLWQFCAHLLDRCRVLRNAQRDDAVEQEKEKEYEYGVVDEYGESYLDMDSAEEEEDLEMEEHVWQQYNDDTSELRATGRYNNPNSPSTPAPSAMKPKRQDQYRSLGIDLNPLTRPSMDMDMDEWESVAASWDLSLGTCISSSSTSSDIY